MRIQDDKQTTEITLRVKGLPNREPEHQTALLTKWYNLTPKQVAIELKAEGVAIPRSIYMEEEWPSVEVVGKDTPSNYDARLGKLTINENDKLSGWWTRFMSDAESAPIEDEEEITPKKPCTYMPTVKVKKCNLSALGTTIKFHQTLRVPDDGQHHKLPPSLGEFPLVPVKPYLDRLPESIASRGGYLMPMYQREALWMSFKHESGSPNAIKVSVGGINALTGYPQDKEDIPAGTQDYLCKTQPWLDGIAKEPGKVRQFVAVNTGEGYTIEEQLTGKNTEATMQFDIFPMLRKDGRYEADGVSLGSSKSPAQLGIAPGKSIRIMPKDIRKFVMSAYVNMFGTTLTFSAGPGPKFKVRILCKSKPGFDLDVTSETTVKELLELALDAVNCPEADRQTFTCVRDGHRIYATDLTLEDHDILDGAVISLEQSSIRHRASRSSSASSSYYSDSLSILSGADDDAPHWGGPLRSSKNGVKVQSIGIAAGGSISQKIHEDTNSVDDYSFESGKRIYVHAIAASSWKAVTGRDAPISPVTKKSYTDHSIPWFELYNEPASTGASGAGLAKIQSVAEKDKYSRTLDSENDQDKETFAERWKEEGHGTIIHLGLNSKWKSHIGPVCKVRDAVSSLHK